MTALVSVRAQPDAEVFRGPDVFNVITWQYTTQISENTWPGEFAGSIACSGVARRTVQNLNPDWGFHYCDIDFNAWAHGPNTGFGKCCLVGSGRWAHASRMSKCGPGVSNFWSLKRQLILTSSQLLVPENNILSTPAMSFKNLFPELFPVITNHLPLAHRPTTLLSLALTCHQIYRVIVPYLLYRDVRLAGDQSVSALTALNAKAQSVTKREASPSHCIRHLCINSVSKFGVFSPNSVLDILQNLIDADGLPNLSSLTLHISSDWNGIVQLENIIDAYLIIPSQFWQSLKSKCPNLKNINMTEISQTVGDEWIERELLSLKASQLSYGHLSIFANVITSSRVQYPASD